MGSRIGIVGASGYTGAELLRLTLEHPDLEPTVVTSREFEGRAVRQVYPNLPTGLSFVGMDLEQLRELDLVFLALPHGASASVGVALADASCRVVDLSADFRFQDPSIYLEWFGGPHPAPGDLSSWVYGLPELHRSQIASAARVANPGCYPTATLLAIAPLVSAGALDLANLVVTASSGVSGAGRAVSAGVHFSHVSSNISYYGAPKHKHTPEIEQEIGRLSGSAVQITFLPQLVPMPRGLLASVIAPAIGPHDPLETLTQAYADEPFVEVIETWPGTKVASGSNRAFVTARRDERTGRIIAACAIDNLGKGAAGQAVQNANLMLGLSETTGLTAGGVYP